MLFGAPIFGIISDTFGRRKSLAISLFLLFVFGACSALSTNFGTLAIMRLVTGFVFGGATQGFILCAEYYPSKGRGIAGFYLRYFWSCGYIALILMTWLVMHLTNDWRYIVVMAAVPSLIVFFSMSWFPESSRWYLVSGKYDKAVAELAKLLQMNNSYLEATQLRRIPQEELETKGNFLSLMRGPYIKTTLLLWYISFAAAFHYYGITLLAPYVIHSGSVMVPISLYKMRPVSNFSGSGEFFSARQNCLQSENLRYDELLINCFAEFPGLIVFTIVVRYAERRTLLSVAFMINFFMVMVLLAEAHSRIPTQVILFIMRANCTGILQLVLIITSETYPTSFRATGIGSASAFVRLGGALVPFVVQVFVIEDAITTVCIMGTVVFISAGAAAYLPHDTKGRPLKELVSEQLQANKKEKVMV